MVKKKRIILSNIDKYFTQGNTKRSILKQISASFDAGHTYALTGVSGTGKSTLLHLIAGIEKPNEGAVSINDHNLASFTEQERSSFLFSTIGLVFQQPYLIKELTVIENVMLKKLIAGSCTTDDTNHALDLLDQAGLADKAHAVPGSLSGGQQQRVALLRALFIKPDFLLADEPTGSLDKQTGQSLLALLLSLQKKYGIGMIISTHDATVADAMDTIFELKDGCISTKKVPDYTNIAKGSS